MTIPRNCHINNLFTVRFRLENMCLNRTENVLVCGSSNGMVSIVSIPNLHDVRIFDLSKHGRIRSLCNTTGRETVLDVT